MAVDLTTKIRDVPDFPKPGIVFKDIMPLLADAEALQATIDRLAAWAEPLRPDVVMAVEARGYITGGALACRLGCGFVAARKPGKLPWRTMTRASRSSRHAPRPPPTGASRPSRTRLARTSHISSGWRSWAKGGRG